MFFNVVECGPLNWNSATDEANNLTNFLNLKSLYIYIDKYVILYILFLPSGTEF